MAWRDRLRSGVRRIGRYLFRNELSAPLPPQPPQPPQPTYVPERFFLPIQEPQPDDSGTWWVGEDESITSGEEPMLWSRTPVYNDQPLYDESDDTVQMYDANGERIEYNRVTGQDVQLTADQWYRETFRSKEALEEAYGTDNIDILKFLKDQGYIDDEDWERWREIYGEMFAG